MSTPANGDRMWDTRRTLLKQCLAFCAFFMLFALFFPADRIQALGGLAASVATFAGLVLSAYMGIAEYGRVKGVLGEKETTVTQTPPNKKTTKTKITTPLPSESEGGP